MHLQQQVSAAFAPAHVLCFAHPAADQSIDRALDGARGNAPTSTTPVAVPDDTRLVLFEIRSQVAQTPDGCVGGLLELRHLLADALEQPQ